MLVGFNKDMKGVFLVTGASRGLGRSIALEVAKSGNTVIALARPSIDLDNVESELQTIDKESIAIGCDMALESEISTAVTQIKQRFSHLSGIIHNAGTISPISNLMDAPREVWERAIKVNLVGVQDLTQSLDSIIGGQSHTRILTISSGAAQRSLHGWSAYCVSKAGLDMWTKCVAEEGVNENISAVAIAPGIVDTAMQKEIRDADESDFPLLPNFIDYYRNGELSNPDDVAEKLLPFCLGESGENGDRLDVRNL